MSRRSSEGISGSTASTIFQRAYDMAIHDIGIQFLDEVDTVIGRHVGDQLAGLIVVGRLDHLLLTLLVEVTEDLDPRVGIGRLQYLPGFAGGEALHVIGDSGGMESRAEFAETGVISVRQHLANFR